MNHILLPDAKVDDLLCKSVGTNAMELLINNMLHAGAQRSRLQAKLFGGGRMIAGLSNIGDRNAEFVEAFCRRESIPCRASCLGGDGGRRIQFWPTTGRARLQRLIDVEIQDPPVQTALPETNDVELF